MPQTTPPDWDLTDFYSSLSDPKIKKDQTEIEDLSSKFVKNYKDKTTNSLIKNPKLNSYKHYLTVSRTLKPFTLSEKEEQILSLKSQTSSSAFVRLYDQTESTEKFEMEIGGKKQSLNSSEIASV